MADDLPALDSPPVVIPADVLAALRATPTEAEAAAAEQRISDWMQDMTASSDVPPDLRDAIVEISVRLSASRDAALALVALVDSLDAETAADKMAQAADNLGQLAEITAGYRTKLTTQGFSEMVAEQCALQVHSMMISSVINGQQ